MVDSTYNTNVYMEQGGDKLVLKNGGSIEANGGATMSADTQGNLSILGSGTSSKIKLGTTGAQAAVVYGFNTTGVGTATAIINDNIDNGGIVSVFGESGADQFADVLAVSFGATPTVLHTGDVAGSPQARTYTATGASLIVALATGASGYEITTFKIGL